MMKKVKYLVVCMAVAVFAVWAVGCSSRDDQGSSNGTASTTGSEAGTSGGAGSGAGESTGAGATNGKNSGAGSTDSGNAGTSNADSGNAGTDNSDSGNAGAGSTGSTEGETGVLDGLIKDAEDGLDSDIMDGPGAESSSAGSGNSGR